MRTNPENPEVSVILVTHNRKDLLLAALRTLEAQTEVNKEVFVVDNASDDGTAEAVTREHPSVRLIKNHENRGFCAANNQGIAVASAPYVVLLNNDAEARPEFLAELLRVAKTHPRCGMVASKILHYADPTKIDKAGHLIFLDGQNRGRGTGERDRGQFDREEPVLWPDGCACLYRKQMLDEIGGFDEEFFAYADDAELGMRARLAGWECWYAPSAVVLHHRGQTLGVRSTRRLELIERNRVLLVIKLFPWSLVWLNAPLYLIRLIAGALAAVRGKGEAGQYPGLKGKWQVASALLKGDLQALRLLPSMLRKRRQFQHLRRLSHWQTLRLLWKYRITLKALSEQSL